MMVAISKIEYLIFYSIIYLIVFITIMNAIIHVNQSNMMNSDIIKYISKFQLFK